MGVLISCSSLRNGFAEEGLFGRADGSVYPGERQYPDDRLGVLNKGRFGFMLFCLTTGEATVAMIGGVGSRIEPLDCPLLTIMCVGTSKKVSYI